MLTTRACMLAGTGMLLARASVSTGSRSTMLAIAAPEVTIPTAEMIPIATAVVSVIPSARAAHRGLAGDGGGGAGDGKFHVVQPEQGQPENFLVDLANLFEFCDAFAGQLEPKGGNVAIFEFADFVGQAFSAHFVHLHDFAFQVMNGIFNRFDGAIRVFQVNDGFKDYQRFVGIHDGCLTSTGTSRIYHNIDRIPKI